LNHGEANIVDGLASGQSSLLAGQFHAWKTLPPCHHTRQDIDSARKVIAKRNVASSSLHTLSEEKHN